MLQRFWLSASFILSITFDVFYKIMNRFYLLLLVQFEKFAVTIPCDICPDFYHYTSSFSS